MGAVGLALAVASLCLSFSLIGFFLGRLTAGLSYDSGIEEGLRRGGELARRRGGELARSGGPRP